jgi:hypothetical protein
VVRALDETPLVGVMGLFGVLDNDPVSNDAVLSSDTELVERPGLSLLDAVVEAELDSEESDHTDSEETTVALDAVKVIDSVM